MRIGKLAIATFIISLVAAEVPAFAQTQVARGRSPAQAQQVAAKKRQAGGNRSFFYGNVGYFSFADEILAEVGGQKGKGRSVFTGYSVGLDYTMYMSRYILGWNLAFVTGSVDIQRILGQTYPRKSFLGVQSGPELGYRLNADMDVSWGLNLLYRDIEKVGQSFALSNQLNVKFRFTPRVTFYQSLGNYGKPTAYSYSIGIRWLL